MSETTLSRQQLTAFLTSPGQEFEVQEQQIRGIGMRVFINGPQTMREIVLATEQFGDRPFLIYGDERWTYAEQYRTALGLAKYLHDELGMRKGDRLGVAMRNYPEWATFTMAAAVAGLVLVPLNAWWTADELRYAIGDSGVKVLAADAERTAALAPAIFTDDGIPVIEVRGEGEAVTGVRRWQDVLSALDLDATPPQVDVQPEDDATILYTSGTTGRPKGAVGTHRNHCTNLRNMQLSGAVGAIIANGGTMPEPDPNAPQPGSLCTFAMFHIAGVSTLGISMLMGTRVATQYKWDLDGARELIRSEKLTGIGGVPTVVRAVLEDVANHPDAYATVAGISAGGAPVPPDLIDRIGSLFDRLVSPGNGYGLTETTSAVVSNSGTDYLDRPDSVGVCQPGTDIRVVDPGTGQDVVGDEIGELWFRGPNVVRGYWNNPDATADAFVDGWFRTGDLGRVVDGWVYVLDRIKDVVIRGGENIYCAEVEGVLYEHPQIDDVALIGVPHESLGEEAVAVVVPVEGSALTADEVKQHVAGRLAAFKIPAHVVFQPEGLPRTPTGKVLKKDLRTVIAAAVAK